MPKVFIPQVGDKIELSSNWSCKIFNEGRNSSVFSALGVDVSNQQNTNIDITFLKGTVFKVTRLYVRAPASSYDSLTLSVVSSPIKKLAKAKFWVKIMDANNMEFEDKQLTFDDFDSIYELFMHLSLKDGHPNTNEITTPQRQPYLQEIVNYFTTEENTLSYTVSLNKQQLFDTYSLTKRYYSYYTDPAYEAEAKQVMQLLPDTVNAHVTIYPILDGVIYKIDSIEEIKKIDQELGYFNQFSYDYGRHRRLGSYLSYDYLYFNNNLKKEKPFGFHLAMEQKTSFNIAGQNQQIKTLKEFNKIISSLMKKKI